MGCIAFVAKSGSSVHEVSKLHLLCFILVISEGVSSIMAFPLLPTPSQQAGPKWRLEHFLQFMATQERRARYWARSFAGWHEFAAVQPNRAHYALAEMQRMGWAQSIITQNVDRLHHKAGSRDIIELHGTTHRQVCSKGREARAVLTARSTSSIHAESLQSPSGSSFLHWK